MEELLAGASLEDGSVRGCGRAGFVLPGKAGTDLLFPLFLSFLEEPCVGSGLEALCTEGSAGRELAAPQPPQRCTRTLSFPALNEVTDEGLWRHKLYLWQQ